MEGTFRQKYHCCHGIGQVNAVISCPVSGPNRVNPFIIIEGSANKLGVGIIKRHLDTGETQVLSNVRRTYITPPGQGFLPKDTAKHHREKVVEVVKEALNVAGVTGKDVDCICFTKGTRPFLVRQRIVSDDMQRIKVREWPRHSSQSH